MNQISHYIKSVASTTRWKDFDFIDRVWAILKYDRQTTTTAKAMSFTSSTVHYGYIKYETVACTVAHRGRTLPRSDCTLSCRNHADLGQLEGPSRLSGHAPDLLRFSSSLVRREWWPTQPTGRVHTLRMLHLRWDGRQHNGGLITKYSCCFWDREGFCLMIFSIGEIDLFS